MLIKIAWRNIWRHKTRSGVIIVSVVFGLWSGLFIQSFVNGMMEERVRTAIEKELSHIQIHQPDFKKDFDAKYFIGNGNFILNEISNMPEVKAATGRVLAKGMIATASGSTGIKVNGIDPSTEDKLTHLSSNLIEGNFFSAEKHNEIILGEKLVKKLKLKLHSKVVITLLDNDNNITTGAFRLRGIYKTQNAPYDEGNAFVEREEVAELLNTKNEINEIAVLLKTNNLLDTVYKNLNIKYPILKTETWKEIAPEMEMLVAISSNTLLIYMIIIMLALAFGIINTMLMAVLERTREIGMLLALGMNRTRVFTLILLETFFLVFVGVPIGLFLGFLSTSYFGKYGMNMSAFKDVYEKFGYSEVIYTRLSLHDYQVVVLLVVITILISALFPARRALSLNPSEAIK